MNQQQMREKALEHIATVKKSCEEALDDKWDRSDEGFVAMLDDCNRAIHLIIKLDLKE